MLKFHYSYLTLSWQKLKFHHSYLNHDEDPYHIEPSSLICTANQWTDFYMIGISVMKELNNYDETLTLLEDIVICYLTRFFNTPQITIQFLIF